MFKMGRDWKIANDWKIERGLMHYRVLIVLY